MRLLLLVAAVLFVARIGQADEPARIKFDAGRRYLELGRYADAIREFEAGAEVAPLAKRPLFLLNIGQVYRRWGKLRKARAYYLRFLEVAPADAPERPTTRDLLGEVEGELVFHPEPEEAPPLPPPTVIVPVSPPPPSLPVAPPSRISPLPWVIAAVGVAALGGGTACGVLSGQRRDDAAGAPVQTDAFAALTDAQRFATAANVLFIAGGIVAAAGLAWGIVELARRGRKREPLAPSVGGAMGLAW